MSRDSNVLTQIITIFVYGYSPKVLTISFKENEISLLCTVDKVNLSFKQRISSLELYCDQLSVSAFLLDRWTLQGKNVSTSTTNESAA